jgi:hypothetical protein
MNVKANKTFLKERKAAMGIIGRFYRHEMGVYEGGRSHKKVDKALHDCNLVLIRAAARFFSGVPHPHLLGVCCPDFSS